MYCIGRVRCNIYLNRKGTGTFMKKMFDEDDEEFQDFDKAKIIVSVIPVILIVLILAIMLLINN